MIKFNDYTERSTWEAVAIERGVKEADLVIEGYRERYEGSALQATDLGRLAGDGALNF